MKQKLLIVEDDRLMAEAAADYFAGKGWEVKKAEDGAEKPKPVRKPRAKKADTGEAKPKRKPAAKKTEAESK